MKIKMYDIGWIDVIHAKKRTMLQPASQTPVLSDCSGFLLKLLGEILRLQISLLIVGESLSKVLIRVDFGRRGSGSSVSCIWLDWA